MTSQEQIMDLRERMAKAETLVEGLLTSSIQQDRQIGTLATNVGSLEATVRRDHAVRQAEAARDRRFMKMVLGSLTVLWTLTQFVVPLLVG